MTCAFKLLFCMFSGLTALITVYLHHMFVMIPEQSRRTRDESSGCLAEFERWIYISYFSHKLCILLFKVMCKLHFNASVITFLVTL